MVLPVEDGPIASFLLAHPERDFCDACLATMFDLTTDEVARTAVALGRLPKFLRDRWRCGKCGEETVVTRAFKRDDGARPGIAQRAS